MRMRRGGIAVVFALVATVLAVARGRVRRYVVSEESMEPALRSGDYVIAVRSDSTPRRGDIVILPHPQQPDFELAKRIVGLPGEKLVIANGQVHVDGSPLPEPWAEGPTRPDGEWALADHALFVLGDQRSRSAGDGRELGPVPVDTVRWRVAMRYWPPGRIELI